jgi:RHS repeat-associated protein
MAADFDRLVEFGYDQDDKVTAVSTYDVKPDGLYPVSPTMNVTYDPSNGLPVSTSLGNLYTGQTYNEKGELDSYEADYNGSAIFHTNYERDSLGRITELRETVDGKSEKKNYAYDIAGRLASVWRNDTLISTYSYDANGNRIAKITPTSADSGTYDVQDRLLTYSSTSYSYTSNGELRLKVEGSDTTRYTYDYFGNLTKVIIPNGDRIDYIIDGQNRRIGKKINGAVVRRWIYSGQLSPIAELDSARNVVAQFVGRYMVKDGIIYRLVADHLGSIKLVVDVATGMIAQKLEYDEFGNVLSNTNPEFQPFAYAGGIYDSQTKLVRFGVRDYDASVGRWTAKDPIRFGGGVSNLFEYIVNDPINLRDLYGFQGNPPPVPVPGGGANNGWKWNPDPGNSRGGSWGPINPIPGQSQPSASHDPEGHWDVDNGLGDRQRVDDNGKPISAEEAHKKGGEKCPNKGQTPSEKQMETLRNIGYAALIITTALLTFLFGQSPAH